jgi:hypothetical protein
MAMIAAALLSACLAQDAEKFQKLVQALGDPSKEERDKAVQELVKVGRPALDALRKATGSPDAEVKALAAQAIEKIEWGGVDALKKFAREQLDEAATVELSKIKAPARWFPDTRFYEVSGGAAAGPAAAMGMQAPKSLFAIRKYEPGFQRLMVKGIYSAPAIRGLIAQQKISLADQDAALDFAVAFMEIYTAGAGPNMRVYVQGGATRLEKSSEGWTLDAGNYGSHMTFKTDSNGTLVDVVPSSNPYFPFGQNADKRAEERSALEIEKLKMEVELLKRQLEKK